jgi:hypothetical protein
MERRLDWFERAYRGAAGAADTPVAGEK